MLPRIPWKRAAIMKSSPMPDTAPFPSIGELVVAGLSKLRAHVVVWLQTCADYYEAAAIFDQLSRLSNAELSCRGLSRATLARDVCEACISRDSR